MKNSIFLLDLLLNLDLFTMLKKESDYKMILPILFKILLFDKSNIKFVTAIYNTDKNETAERKKK